MGKAVFCNIPAHGGINPLLATVAELVRRGEEIVYFATEEFREKIEKTGALFRPYKGKIDKVEVINNDMIKFVDLLLEMTVDKLDHNLDDIRREEPDYLVHDSMCMWGKCAATLLDLPAVSLMHTYPTTETSMALSFDALRLLPGMIRYAVASRRDPNSAERRLKSSYGIDLDLRDILVNRQGLNLVFTSKCMEPKIYDSEDTYCFVGPSLFFREDASTFPFSDLSGRKVVYASLGTVHSDNPRFYELCMEALGESEYLVVMSVGRGVDISQFAEVPENFTIRRSVPQQKLLGFVDLFITHSGMNSVNEALCYGVPMLLLPHHIEQKAIARRVVRLGAGLSLKIEKLTSDELRRSVKRLLSDSRFGQRAKAWSEIFGEEEKTSHIRAADEILRFIQR